MFFWCLDAAHMYFITRNWITCSCVLMQERMAMMLGLPEDPVRPIQR